MSTRAKGAPIRPSLHSCGPSFRSADFLPQVRRDPPDSRHENRPAPWRQLARDDPPEEQARQAAKEAKKAEKAERKKKAKAKKAPKEG